MTVSMGVWKYRNIAVYVGGEERRGRWSDRSTGIFGYPGTLALA
jgi:hypothetical protein